MCSVIIYLFIYWSLEWTRILYLVRASCRILIQRHHTPSSSTVCPANPISGFHLSMNCCDFSLHRSRAIFSSIFTSWYCSISSYCPYWAQISLMACKLSATSKSLLPKPNNPCVLFTSQLWRLYIKAVQRIISATNTSVLCFFYPMLRISGAFAPPAVRLITTSLQMSEPPLNEKIKTHANALSAMPDDKR